MRGLKPEFWTDSKVVRLSPLARMLYLGSWHYACDNGHVHGDPLELKIRLLPLDNCDPEALVAEIAEQGLFETDAEGNLTVPNFRKHQKIDPRYPNVCDRCTPRQREEADANRRTRGRGGDTASAHGQPTGTQRAHTGDTSGTHRAPVGAHDEGEGEGEGERKGGPRKRGSRLPDIFPITEEMATWGRENAPLVNAQREHDKFCDYWRSLSGSKAVKRDWTLTWKNWMRRAQEYAEERQGPASSQAQQDLPDWMLA